MPDKKISHPEPKKHVSLKPINIQQKNDHDKLTVYITHNIPAAKTKLIV